MGTLYLVRHGQASFGALDYDNLSELGQKQSVLLGEYLRSKGMQFEAVLTGSLRRHGQTWAGIAQGAGLSHEPLVWPGLNEYDSDAVIRAIHPDPLVKPDTPELYRHHFRLLRQGLTAWMKGLTQPHGMASFKEFASGVTSALGHIQQNHTGNVLLVSSGGPISTAIGHVLASGPEAVVELNMRIRNSAVTEFSFNPKRHVLQTFNTLPHLDHPDRASWITYA
jgi:broad specificity phosphatase PhoE